MAEFNFSKLTPELISKTMLDAIRNPKADNIGLQAFSSTTGIYTPVSMVKAKDLLTQARNKAPPNGWRHFFRAIRRQPRVNILVFRLLAEVIKILRRFNGLMEKLHEQVDLTYHQTAIIQEQIRQVAQVGYEQQEEIASVREVQTQHRDIQGESEKRLREIQIGQQNESIRSSHSLNELRNQCEQLLANQQSIIEERWRELSLERESLQSEIRILSTAQQQDAEEHNVRFRSLVENTDSMAEQAASFQKRLDFDLQELRARVLRADRSARRLPNALNSSSLKKSKLSKNIRPQAAAQFDYFMFEQRFRGDMTVIRQRQESYLGLFRTCKNVVDLGCGRGEFVELLTANEIPAQGIDFNPEMIDCCRARGLEVIQVDLLDYLGSLADQCLDGIFSAQVIEHFPSEQIMRFVALCGKKLKPGGVAVVETINANCLYALGNFYLDPTHVKPVPFGLLQFMFEEAGFVVKEIRFSGLVPGMSGDPVLRMFNGGTDHYANYQDYAVIAERAA